jgi:hypothetical protein
MPEGEEVADSREYGETRRHVEKASWTSDVIRIL